MDSVVTVQGKAQNIPNYPVYASGARIASFPIYQFTPDGKTEAGLNWNPQVILTGKETTFVVVFFYRAKPSFLPFDYVIAQDACKCCSDWNERSPLHIPKFRARYNWN
jgi:hypothetical protein